MKRSGVRGSFWDRTALTATFFTTSSSSGSPSSANWSQNSMASSSPTDSMTSASFSTLPDAQASAKGIWSAGASKRPSMDTPAKSRAAARGASSAELFSSKSICRSYRSSSRASRTRPGLSLRQTTAAASASGPGSSRVSSSGSLSLFSRCCLTTSDAVRAAPRSVVSKSYSNWAAMRASASTTRPRLSSCRSQIAASRIAVFFMMIDDRARIAMYSGVT